MEEIADSYFRNTTLSTELSRILRSKGDLISGSDTIFARYRPDLSYGPDAGPLRARFYTISIVRILPGHEAEFTEFRRGLKAAHQKANETGTHSVYEVVLGHGRRHIHHSHSTNALRDLNLGLESLGEADRASGSRQSESETQVFAIRPPYELRISSWLAADPEFWTTNSASRPPADQRRAQARPKP
jgi:hypothetical protein